MVIGVMQVELKIEWARCLKDKRRVVMSLKDRLHRNHQVSVAEIDPVDQHGVAFLGIALVTNSARYGQSVFDRILHKLRAARDCVLSDHAVEFLPGRR